MKKQEKVQGEVLQETSLRDSILTGVVQTCARANNIPIEVIPEYNGNLTVYKIRGDLNKVLNLIAANTPIGARDALEAIKNCRSAIYLFRQGVK